jgi:hypothetical protein
MSCSTKGDAFEYRLTLDGSCYHPTGLPRFCSSSHFFSGAK